MNDAEISRRLALAIGWSDADPEDPDVVIFRTPLSGQYLEDHCAVWFEQEWRTFDYRDPVVIWSIAERFDCFPIKCDGTGDSAWIAYCEDVSATFADTSAKAVALAVIKAHEGSKT